MLGLYLAFGIMMPIKLGTVSVLQVLNSMGLVNTLTGLIVVYTAQSLPLAIWILSEFMKQVNNELKEALEKQLFDERQDVIRLTVSSNSKDEEAIKKINFVIDTLVENKIIDRDDF